MTSNEYDQYEREMYARRAGGVILAAPRRDRRKAQPKQSQSSKHYRQLQARAVQEIEARRVEARLQASEGRERAQQQRRAGTGRGARTWRRGEVD